MKILRHTASTEPAYDDSNPVVPHPESCPWCGQQRVRGIISPSTQAPQYRCAACNTTFFIHTPTPRPLVHGRSRQ